MQDAPLHEAPLNGTRWTRPWHLWLEQIARSFNNLSQAHNDLTGIQGGTTGEYYHLTSADSAEAVSFLNGGTATHTQLDNERTSSIAHRADTAIHFEQADIDHTAINNIGTYTHNDIDDHIDDVFLHNQYPPLTTYTYSGGDLVGISNSLGTKTYNYSGGDLVSITGTGIYKNITFTYNGSGDLIEMGIS